MIPSGLIDKNIEFFALDGELFSLQDGIRYRYPEMPEDHLMFLRNMLTEDTTAGNTLDGIPLANRLKIYGICRFGACNHIPDSTEEGDCADQNEYYDCGIRGVCPHEGKRCKDIVMPNGVLTAHMIKIIKLVAEGFIDKEIASKLGISVNTVNNHLATIITRTVSRTRVDITRFAKERGII